MAYDTRTFGDFGWLFVNAGNISVNQSINQLIKLFIYG